MADEAQRRHLEFTRGFYSRSTRMHIGSVLSGYGDAAHMCDAIAADIEVEHTVRGKVTKQGKALADAARRAGDAIWAMRDQVFPAPTKDTPNA